MDTRISRAFVLAVGCFTVICSAYPRTTSPLSCNWRQVARTDGLTISNPLLSAVGFAVSVLTVAGVANAADDSPSMGQMARPASPADIQLLRPQSTPPTVSVAAPEFGIQPGKVVMERLQDGTRLYHLNGQGMQSVVAHKGADGKIEITCTDKIDQLVQRAAENRHER